MSVSGAVDATPQTGSSAPAAPVPSPGATGGPPAGAPAAAPPYPSRDGWIQDSGAVRRDSVRASRWTVRGAAKITGPVDVDVLEVDGTLSVGGALRAGALTVRGPIEVAGPARIEGRAAIHGPARFAQGIEAGELEIEGALNVSNGLRVAGLARIAGDAVLSGEARIGRWAGEGALTVRGTIRAERFAFRADRDSRLGTLIAGSVTVQRPPPALPFHLKIPFFGTERPTVDALRIECSDADLDGVTVEVLRADRIVLGPDCHVARAIGTLVRVDRRAHVGPESRSPPPYGITP